MILTADTNVLVRAVIADDPGQAAAVIEALRQAILDCPLQGVRKLDLPAS